ncbi:hypothetical protein GGI07_003392 [Coemansia sp. Benny D115]|nr:hypothetical protein GGI07_003392 [Coemansia sp. Benny D115]
MGTQYSTSNSNSKGGTTIQDSLAVATTHFGPKVAAMVMAITPSITAITIPTGMATQATATTTATTTATATRMIHTPIMVATMADMEGFHL